MTTLSKREAAFAKIIAAAHKPLDGNHWDALMILRDDMTGRVSDAEKAYAWTEIIAAARNPLHGHYRDALEILSTNMSDRISAADKAYAKAQLARM